MEYTETTFELKISDIYPQQHYLCREKLLRVETDFDSYEDLGKIYVINYKDKYFSVDGHHRLFIANQRGVEKVMVTMENEDNEYKLYQYLADEAYALGLRNIADLEYRIISEAEFEVKWIGKCQSIIKDMADK